MTMKRTGFQRFVLKSLLALLPVAVYVALYLVVDPFRVVYRYDGIAVEQGDTLERIPNKRFVAIEGLKCHNAERRYDSFIFGSSISSNFSAEAWKRHLPDSASVYHFTAGSETLTGIRDELRYLIAHGYPVRHAMLVMEEEMFRRPVRAEEMPYVPHYDVAPSITRLHFHRLHFNAWRNPDILFYNLWPTTSVVNRLLRDGKMTTVPCRRDELLNEDYSTVLDSTILTDPEAYYSKRLWLVMMQPNPGPMPLSIDAQAERTLRDIAALLHDAGTDYIVIVPPRFRSQPLSAIDHAALCDIMGKEHVNDFSADSTLVNDLNSYYDGVHILTHRCTELIDRSYSPEALVP